MIAPTIILDKSSLQSFSHDELLMLNRYYVTNITPILCIEILSDLKKEYGENISAGDNVMLLAKKLKQFNSVHNVDYVRIITESLLGQRINMDGRPAVGGGKHVIDKEGRKGIIYEESNEEKAITRWCNGKFKEAELYLAEKWREVIKTIDLNHIEKIYAELTKRLALTKSLIELQDDIDKYLHEPSLQYIWLKLMLCEFSFDETMFQQIIKRWDTKKVTLLADFAPYAFFCFRVIALFYTGLIRNHIGKKSTNRIDLEYLFYLPFANVISSNDKFHVQISPCFLRRDQEFINGVDLKLDLRNIFNYWSQLSEKEKAEWKREHGNDPLHNSESITYRLWKQYGRLIDKSNNHKKVSSNGQEENLVEKIKMIEEECRPATPQEEAEFDESNVQFMLRKRYISVDDPCPCGSGKKYRDCHGKSNQ